MPGTFEMRALTRIVALIAAVVLIGASAARAQGYEAAVARFAADSFSETDAAISAVAASGDPRAAQVIEALQDARLAFSPGDRKVYIRAKSGELIDAATGRPAVGAPAGLKPVRLNNRLRRSVDAALGAL